MMLSKLLRPASNLLSKQQSGKRFKELYEYLCLREALNPKESEGVLKELEAASKKLKITPNQATEIIYLIQNDPSYYKGYLKDEDLQQLENIFESELASSKIQAKNKNLGGQYSELVQFTKPAPERAAGIKTLEDIFLKDGPSGARAQDSAAILHSIPAFKNRIKEHVKTLQGKSATLSPDHDASKHKSAPVASRINKVLDDIVTLLEISPTLTYGRIRAFVALSKGLPEPERKAIGSGETSLQAATRAQEEEIDLPSLIQERTLSALKTASFQLAPWVNDRLRIFEADKASSNHSGIWNTVGIVGTLEFLYLLIQQESALTVLATTGLIGYYGLHRGIRALRKDAADKLSSVDLHRDGKYVDIVVESTSGSKTVLDLPIEKFKVHGNFRSIDAKSGNLKDLASIVGATSTITAKDLQESGLADLGQLATYNDNYVFIPQNHSANKAHIGNLFQGKQAAIADSTPKNVTA